MDAVIFKKPGQYAIENVPVPEIKNSDELLIRVEAAGMCGTDFHIVSIPQKHPAKEDIILGHEFSGEVMEIGSEVRSIKKGMRVIVGPNVPCGGCNYCKRGKQKFCSNMRTHGITMDGGFAQYVVVSERVAYPVPLNITAEQAIFAEPLSCVLNGFHKLGTIYNSKIIILGAGPIGQYFIRLCRHFGAREIIISEPIEKRQEIAKISGATQIVNSLILNDETLQDITAGGADIVIDTVGNLLELAVSSVRKGGKVLIFGMDQTCTCSVNPYRIVRDEKQIMGCFIDNNLIPDCLDLLPVLAVEELISHRFQLSEIHSAFNLFHTKNLMKIIVSSA